MERIRLGDIVEFYGETRNGVSLHPAIVTRIWSPGCVNLAVFFDGEGASPRSSVQHESFKPAAGFRIIQK